MIIFLGSLVEKNMEDNFRTCSKASLPQSSNTHQLSIISGLREYTEVYIVNRLPFGAYPQNVRCKSVPRSTAQNIVNMKCCNVPLFRNHQQTKATAAELELIKEKEKDIQAVVAYMPFMPRMRALQIFKKNHPSIPIFVIVPDLVQHSYSKEGYLVKVLLTRFLREREGKKLNNMSYCVDGFIYLTEAMHQKFGENHPYIVQEAVYEDTYTPKEQQKQKDSFTFTYCGKLNAENGVDRLISAFMRLENSHARLQLCGTGVDLPKYKKAAQSDSRIYFTGMLTHEQVLDCEHRSDALVNPRFTSIPNAAYSFPSKIIEYLACGKPVISSKLKGIPGDYDSHLIYIEDDSVESLQRAMNQILSKSEKERVYTGNNNREFVRLEKSPKAQGKRMYDFICDICDAAKERK